METMKIKATIEKGEDLYTIISPDVIAGCHFAGYGETIAEAKEDFFEGIKESLETAVEMGKEVPVDASDIMVDFQYDVISFFNAFQWIKIGAFAKEAGINESKMRAYKSGLATASEKTMEKMRAALKRIAAELSASSF